MEVRSACDVFLCSNKKIDRSKKWIANLRERGFVKTNLVVEFSEYRHKLVTFHKHLLDNEKVVIPETEDYHAVTIFCKIKGNVNKFLNFHSLFNSYMN